MGRGGRVRGEVASDTDGRRRSDTVPLPGDSMNANQHAKYSGSLWLTILTFNKPLHPVKLETQCPIFGHS